MPSALRDVGVPAFGVPLEAPRIPATTYEKRCREAYARAECDWLVVYADREHLANIAFLSGYDPRFEEALLLLGPRETRVLVVGNEGEAYAPLAEFPDLDIALAQSLSLMGQDRSLKPDLAAVLREAGLSRGRSARAPRPAVGPQPGPPHSDSNAGRMGAQLRGRRRVCRHRAVR
jgi:hypothetical protein